MLRDLRDDAMRGLIACVDNVCNPPHSLEIDMRQTHFVDGLFMHRGYRGSAQLRLQRH